jgi:hypothetical protein
VLNKDVFPLQRDLGYDNNVARYSLQQSWEFPDMTEADSDTKSTLAALVAQAVSYGADELDIEYKDEYEEICAMKNGMGFGIARLESSGEEACDLRKVLCAIGRKGKHILVDGKTFQLKVASYDSFGETAYRVKIKPVAGK